MKPREKGAPRLPFRVGSSLRPCLEKGLGLAGVPHAPARLVAEPYPPSSGGQSSDRGVHADLGGHLKL